MPQIRTNLSNSDILTFGYKLKDFNIKGSKGFPYTITTGYLNGAAYVFPADLESDVIELHKKVFKNKNYKPSKGVLEISAQIAHDAGLSSGQSVVDPDAVIENPTNNTDNLNPIIHSSHRTIIHKIVEKTKAEIRVETSRTRSHSSQIQIKDKLSQCSQFSRCSRYSQLIHNGMIKEIRRKPNLFL